MFVDRVTIEVQAGKGGDGAVSFLREAFRPRGGPDGGDGGNGGSVVFEVSTHRSTLQHLAGRHHYKAESGRPGGTKNCTGRSGKDLVVEVPPGTLVYRLGEGQDEPAEDAEPVVDLTAPGETRVIARGGWGGRGNASFATALNQAPREATRGKPGQGGRYRLELKLIAEVGIVGLPNAGKSTFISRVSSAKPKVASYPFTTLVPNLGVAKVGGRDLVLADIPGLIEGASEGKGLGDDFLRHVERTRVLLHLVDGAGPEFGGDEPVEAYRTIRRELERYADGALAARPEVLALNKSDVLGPEETARRAAALAEASGADVLVLSGVSGDGCAPVLEALLQTVDRARAEAAASEDGAGSPAVEGG
jgi:GTP-binding protein